MRAKPSVPRVRVKRVIRSASCAGLLLAARERADFTYRELFAQLVLFQLVLDVLRNSARVLSCRIHIVPSAPEFFASILVFELAELLIQHCAALAFQIPQSSTLTALAVSQPAYAHGLGILLLQ